MTDDLIEDTAPHLSRPCEDHPSRKAQCRIGHNVSRGCRLADAAWRLTMITPTVRCFNTTRGH